MTYMTRSWMLLKDRSQLCIGAELSKRLRKSARPVQIAYVRIMTKHCGDPSGVEYRHHSDPERWAFVLPDASGDGMRIQFFDLRSFSGHQCYQTLDEAVQEMVKQGYRIEDPGVLDRVSVTSAWAEGLAWLDRVFRASVPRAAA